MSAKTKSKRGRPSTPPALRRSMRLVSLYTPAEYAALEAARLAEQKRAGKALSLGEFQRARTLAAAENIP